MVKVPKPMNTKLILVISLAANLLLGAYALKNSGARPVGSVEAKAASPASTQSAEKPKDAASAPASAAKSSPAPINARKFNWESVESPDYKEYIANLRSIGCPEETIRDIILADVSKLYDEKKKQARGGPKKFEYWKAGNPMLAAMDSDSQQKIAALNEEKNNVLRSLGIEPDFKTQAADMMSPLEVMFDFIPEGKRGQILKVMNEMQSKMAKTMKDGQPDPADIMKAQKESEEAIKAFLTPEEALQYDLRLSMTANVLRGQVPGFDPSEEEFLKVFNLKKGFDDEFNPFMRGNETDDERKKREEAEKKLNEEIKTALGDSRYEDYTRAQDYQYQQMLRAARKGDMGTAEANKLYEMKKLAEQKANEVRVKQDMDQEQRNAALAAIRQETEAEAAKLLGEKGWKEYNKQANTWWLKNIHSEPKPAPQP